MAVVAQAVRPLRVDAATLNLVTLANTTAATNSNNVGDLPATVNAIVAALKTLGLTQ